MGMKKLGIIFAAIITFSISAAGVYWILSSMLGSSVKKETIAAEVDPAPVAQKKTTTPETTIPPVTSDSVGVIVADFLGSVSTGSNPSVLTPSNDRHVEVVANTTLKANRTATLYLKQGGIVRMDDAAQITVSTTEDNASVITLLSGKVYVRAPQGETNITVVMPSKKSYTHTDNGVLSAEVTDKTHIVTALHQLPTPKEAFTLSGAAANTPFSAIRSTSQASGAGEAVIANLASKDIEADSFIIDNIKADIKAGYSADNFGAMQTAAEKQFTKPSLKPITANASLAKKNKSIFLTWHQAKPDAGNTVKIIYSENKKDIEENSPSAAQAQSKSTDANTQYYTFPIEDGKSYYIRTCIAKNDICTSYSGIIRYNQNGTLLITG